MGWFRRSDHPEEQLSAYLDGELNARQASAVERHLAGCVACSALLEDLRSAKSMLAAMPRETPRRSFVLGPEHARERIPAQPPRRFALTFAPAIALTVFVALLVVDLGSFTSNSASSTHNESAGALKTTADRQAVATDSAVTAPAVQGFTPETPSAGAGAAQAPAPGTQGSAPADATPLTTFAAPIAPNASSPNGAVPPPTSGVTSAGSAASASGSADSGASGPNVFGAAETPAVQPVAQPANGTGSGPSTLRILEIFAGAAFLSSTFFVFFWPRLKLRGDS